MHSVQAQDPLCAGDRWTGFVRPYRQCRRIHIASDWLKASGISDLLAIDDFAIAPVTAAERNDLLELLDDRVGTRATLITSQLPVSAWHEWLNDPTLADAILDRIVHAAHKIALKGESMRRKQAMP